MKVSAAILLLTTIGSAAALAPPSVDRFKKVAPAVKKSIYKADATAKSTFNKAAPTVKKSLYGADAAAKRTVSKAVPVRKVATSARKASTQASTFFSRASSGFLLQQIPGAVAPTGIWDPWDLAGKADANTLKRYRESELAHSRVAMLAVVGFIVGEAVEGSSFLWDASVSGPAITHLEQIPVPFWALLTGFIGYLELNRAKIGWVPPEEVPVGKAGLLRDSYNPGELGFDPLNLRPSDPKEYLKLQNNELQNGRLAMLAAAGFLAQELVTKEGIFEYFFAHY